MPRRKTSFFTMLSCDIVFLFNTQANRTISKTALCYTVVLLDHPAVGPLSTAQGRLKTQPNDRPALPLPWLCFALPKQPTKKTTNQTNNQPSNQPTMALLCPTNQPTRKEMSSSISSEISSRAEIGHNLHTKSPVIIYFHALVDLASFYVNATIKCLLNAISMLLATQRSDVPTVL